MSDDLILQLHDLILRLLSRIGFHRITVKWFLEFLVNRIQFVQHGSASSCDLKVTSGTIQGSVLGLYSGHYLLIS